VFIGIIIFFINKKFFGIFISLIFIASIFFLLFWPVPEKVECRYDTFIRMSPNVVLQIEDIIDDYSEGSFLIRFTLQREKNRKTARVL